MTVRGGPPRSPTNRNPSRHFLANLPLLALSLGGCEARTVTAHFVEPGSKRPYEVIRSVSHDARKKAPVLFALHAYATAPESLPRAFSLAEDAADERGFLVVVPRGTIDRDGHPFWNASRGCCGKTNVDVDDLGYLRGVLADLKNHYAVDAERVYALGVSNGAFMAHRWACAGSDLRGIAAISGVGPGPDDPPCRPEVRVRVLQVHGDQDEIIHYDGGMGTKGRYPSAKTSTKQWADVNGCTTQERPQSDRSLVHGRTRKDAWSDSKPCVLLWTFEGGSHELRSVRFAFSEIVDFIDGAR